MSFVENTIPSLISGLLSGTVIAGITSIVLLRKTERIKRDIEIAFLRAQDTMRSQRVWKERSVSELLGPLFMQFERSSRGFKRWKDKNDFIESKIIYGCNLSIRDLLVSKPHLIPPDLLTDAALLVEHYDRWIEEYESVRLALKENDQTPFIFVGPKGFPFPKESETRFRNAFVIFWQELYNAKNENAKNID